MPHITVEQRFNAPVAQVFAALETHEGLARLFWPMQMRLSKPSIFINQPHGLGSERSLGLGPVHPLTERVTTFVPNERIEYELVNAPFVRSHHGTLVFEPLESSPDKSRVVYTIEFSSVFPLLSRPVLAALQYTIQRGFRQLAGSL